MGNKYLDGSLGASTAPARRDDLDQYHQAARSYLDANPNARPSFNASLANKVGQGVTFGWADEAAAGLSALRDKARDPFGRPLSEYYSLEKAMQDELLKDASKRTGAVGTGAEVLGGLASGLGLAKGGATLLREGQGLAARIGAGAVEGAGYGAVQGAGSTEGDKAKGAIGGAVGGAAIGAGLPLLAAGARRVASPVLSNLAASRDPGGYADRKIFETMQRAGMSEADILAEMQAAGRQPYALADALDYEGRRLLSTVTKAPGEGRAQALEFLQSRQADQPDRVVNQLRQGFGAPRTADRLERDIRTQRTLEADVNYGAARNSAGFVNPTDAIRLADDTLGPGVNRLPGVGSQLADDTVESVVRRARSMLTNDREILTDFPSAFRVKRDLDAMIDSANPTQQRELIPIRNALDEALAKASDPYAAARNRFRQQSGQIKAIETGRDAAGSTLAQDAIPAFEAMPRDQLAPFRMGFVDPLISRIVNTTAPGANRAKFSPNAQAKMERFALPSQRRDMLSALERERRMHSTLTEAAGGSKTVENAADAADMGIDPAILSNLMSGQFRNAGMAAARGAFNQLTGNTEAVRSELARRLLPLQGSEPLAALLPRVSKAMRDRQARNNARELTAIRGLLNLGSLGVGRSQ
jgi:hypothetical protein